jgi:hypothetical protein
MRSLKYLVATVAIGAALLAVPAVANARVHSHRPIHTTSIKHNFHRVHRKHGRIHTNLHAKHTGHTAVHTTAFKHHHNI